MNKTSLIFAATLAGMVATAHASGKNAAHTAKGEGMGECHGINSCKGTGECGGKEGNGCKGTNSCKGKGWVSKTEKDCKAAGGQWSKK